METICGSQDTTCRMYALTAVLHSFNLYCAAISAGLILCCTARRRLGNHNRWRGQNTRGIASVLVAVCWCCVAAGASQRPHDTVQLVSALMAPLSWLAAAVLHVSIWTRRLTAPILYQAIYWLFTSGFSAMMVHYFSTKLTKDPLEMYMHGAVSVMSLIMSGVDFVCFYSEIRKRLSPKSSVGSTNISYKYDESHFYSKITFFWLNSLLYRGYKVLLHKADLGEIPENEQSKKYYYKFKNLFDCQKKKNGDSKHRMWICYAQMIWSNFCMAGVLKLFGDIAGIIPAICLSIIIKYIEGKNNNADVKLEETEYSLSNGYVVLTIATISLIFQALLSQNSTHLMTIEGTRLKIAIQSMVYDKCMRIASWSTDTEHNEESPLLPNRENDPATQSGLLTNLMSQDTYNIMSCVWIFHYIWAIPLKVMVILYFLYLKLGISALIGTLVSLFIMTPLQFYIGNKMSQNSKCISKCTDHRTTKISEILQGMTVIKLYVWEDLFNEKILQLREVELQLLNKESIYWGFLIFTTQMSTVLVTVVTFLVHYLIASDVSLTAVNVFAGLALFNQLTISFLILPMTVLLIIQAVVSTKRIRDFLDLPEALNVPDDNKEENCKKSDKSSTLFDNSPDDNPLSEKYESLLNVKDTIFDAENMATTQGQEYLIRLRNAAFSWGTTDDFWLEIGDLDIPAGKLIMVVGASASGKTSLLSAILGEMHMERGDINLNSNCTMWCVNQPPWLLERSIRDNILMDSSWSERRYERVIRATGLRPDVQLLPDGDNTQLGSHGSPLSGGQRVRVCVARALYSRARLLALDEPLAALDAALARQLVARALLPAARSGRTVILATNRLELLHYADVVISMEDGRVSGLGKMNSTCDGVISRWGRLAAEARTAVARCGAGPPGGVARERSQLIKTISRDKFQRELSEDSVYVPQQMEIHDVAGAYLLSEVPTCVGGTWRRIKRRNNGSDEIDGVLSRQLSSPPAPIQRFKWGRDIRRAVSVDESGSTNQGAGNLVQKTHLLSHRNSSRDRWIPKSLERLWSSNSYNTESSQNINAVETSHNATLASLTVNGVETTTVPITSDTPSQEATEPVLNESKIWLEYARVCGWWGLVYIMTAAGAQALALAADYWLSYTTTRNDNIQEKLTDEQMWKMVRWYACWCAGGACAAAVGQAAGACAGAGARRTLHERLLSATLHAPLHRHNLPAAALHRFSADVHVVDRKLPTAVCRWTQLALLCVGAVLVNTISSPWTLIALIPVVIFYMALQDVYLKNVRELHDAEAASAARVLSLSAQTFAGASTVRVARLQARMRTAFFRCLDDNHNTLLILNSANRWLGLTMDLVGAVCVYVSLRVSLDTGSAAAVTGLAGVYSLLLPVYLSHLAKCRADLDMQLAAVQRILTDTTIPQEDYKDDCPIPSGWQRNGRIEFEDVNVCDEQGRVSLLKNINLKIDPGQKIAICGRSGSGKSTFLLSCVGATSMHGGRILIDGQDMRNVPLRTLRHRLVVMPQENIIFSGTLRENLDPLGVHTDEEIWQSLRVVGLYDFIHAQPAGLESNVCGWRGGCGGGRGARVCGARAALHARTAAALLLDEPAAPLDALAECTLLHAMAKFAPNTTILTVTHRVASIRGYDTALVLEQGHVVERGPITELLAQPTSRLTRMLAAMHRPA